MQHMLSLCYHQIVSPWQHIASRPGVGSGGGFPSGSVWGSYESSIRRDTYKTSPLHFVNIRICACKCGASPYIEGMAKEIVTTTQKMSFGPAMSALNARQRAFVVSYNNAGGKNAAEAYRAAGYQAAQPRQEAYSLLHDPKIKAAIVEDVQTRLAGCLTDTVQKIIMIGDEPGAKQLDALKFLAHHGGLIEKSLVQHDHTVTLTFDQKLERARQLALDAGLDPAKELIDITPTTVTDVDDDEPEVW